MDGGNGGWAVLRGSNPLTSDTINLGVEEDQAKDSERKHTPEQMAYFIIADMGAEGEASFQNASPPKILSPLDINQDGYTTPIDALLIINWLNQTSPQEAAQDVLDTNRDGFVTPIDALLTINQLNEPVPSVNRQRVSSAASYAPLVDSVFDSFDKEDEEDLYHLP